MISRCFNEIISYSLWHCFKDKYSDNSNQLDVRLEDYKSRRLMVYKVIDVIQITTMAHKSNDKFVLHLTCYATILFRIQYSH